MRLALTGSAALHFAVAAMCLSSLPAPPAPVLPPLEVELVEQAPVEPGSAPEQAQAAVASAPAPPVDAASSPAPAPAAAPTETRRETSAAINLGNGARDLEGLSVTGENVVPPAPDALFRNKAPTYPPAAARARAEGTVQLLIRVSTAGVPEQVFVAQSSGHADLDRAARDAVLLWRFRPALAEGAPVPFDYVMNIRFSLADR